MSKIPSPPPDPQEASAMEMEIESYVIDDDEEGVEEDISPQNPTDEFMLQLISQVSDRTKKNYLSFKSKKGSTLKYKKLNKVVDAINAFHWMQYYAIPANISEFPSEFKMSYGQYLLHSITKLHKAIDSDNWNYIGQLIGSIDIDSRKRAGNNPWYTGYKTLVTYNLLWEHLFFIGFQRILFRSDISPRLKAISLEHMFQKFHQLVATESFKVRKLLPLFVISVLIFGVAHNNKECINAMLNIKIPGKFNDSQLSFNIRAYQLYVSYLELNEEGLNNAMTRDLFQTMLEFFESAGENEMKKLLFLFEPFIRLSKDAEEVERALNIVIRCCNETPALVPFAASILKRCGLPSLVGKLITECLEHDPLSTFLHRFPLVIHYVSHRTMIALEKRSFWREEAEKHVRMLFNFLDYGKNRGIGEAWLSFKCNLECLKPFPEWIHQEWNERESWWPRFHNIPLEEENYEAERAKVFKMLQRGSRKRKLLM